MNAKCGYAFPGTYGHECGKPATLAASKISTHTATGIYWAKRCEQCRDATGSDNWGLSNWQPYREELHTNKWK